MTPDSGESTRLSASLYLGAVHAIRTLARNPKRVAAIVALMSCAIGATIAVFSAIEALVLRPLPYGEPDRIVAIDVKDPVRNVSQSVSYMDFQDLRTRNSAFDSLSGFYTKPVTLTGAGNAEDIWMGIVSANLFDLLKVKPMLGRGFLPDEDKRGNRSAVISYSLWSRVYRSDENIVSKSVVLNGKVFTIVGVMPRPFEFPVNLVPVEAWITHALDMEPLPGGALSVTLRREARYMNAIGRLKDGMTMAAARVRVQTVMTDLKREHPETKEDRIVKIIPELDRSVGALKPVLWALFGASALLLLIGCTSAANLLLNWMLARRREFWVRHSLGASRRQLTVQLLMEALLLSTASTAAGLLLALWVTNLFLAASSNLLPRAVSVTANWRVLAFSLAAAVLTACIFGVLPAWQGSRMVNEMDGRSTERAQGMRMRWLIVMAQEALAVVLLIGAGLTARNLLDLMKTPLGFHTDHVLMFMINTPPARYDYQKQAAFHQKLIPQLMALPQVISAASITPPPFNKFYIGASFTIDGAASTNRDQNFTEWHVATPGYFKTLRISLLGGKDFDGSETLTSRPVAIVSESMARYWFRGKSPVGHKVQLELGDNPPLREIVGVVSDTKQKSITADMRPVVYLPHSQFPFNLMTVFIHTSGDPLLILPTTRKIVRQLDADIPLTRPVRFDDYVSGTIGLQRSSAMLLSGASMIALLLTIGGLYALVSQVVAQRAKEIGIRMALGAEPSTIVRLVTRQTLLFALIGLGVGLAAVLVFGGVLKTLLSRVGPTDPITLAAILGFMLLISFAAAYIPTRRCTRMEVARVLREE